MPSEKNSILSSASHYAIYLGLFWVFKYLFVIGGDYSELSKYVYSILSIGTPIILYVILCRYRDKRLKGTILYGQAILFTLALFVFASLIEAIIVSLHLLVINPSLVIEQNQEVYTIFEKMKLPGQSMQVLDMILSLGAFYYIICIIIGNICLGFFLSLIFGYLASHPKRNQSPKF